MQQKKEEDTKEKGKNLVAITYPAEYKKRALIVFWWENLLWLLKAEPNHVMKEETLIHRWL